MALRVTLAGIQAVFRSLRRIPQRLLARAFWQGQGYWTDPAHGGLTTHIATPQQVQNELTRFGFRCLRALGDDYPLTSGPYVTDWYYYVFSKSSTSGEQ